MLREARNWILEPREAAFGRRGRKRQWRRARDAGPWTRGDSPEEMPSRQSDGEAWKNRGTGADEKVHRGNSLVEKRSDKSGVTFTQCTWETEGRWTLPLLCPGTGGTYEKSAAPSLLLLGPAALEKMEGWALAVLLTISSKHGVQRTEESHPPEGPQEMATKVTTNGASKDTVVRALASEITVTV